METIDEEITSAALAWMEKRASARAGRATTANRMVTHDEQVGELRKKLDELGIADNTIVMYSTDNGPETILGLMARTRRSALRKTRIGKAHGAFPLSCAGVARSSPVRSSTASALTTTCCRPCWRPLAIST
jgi:arylsulfatase A-like enzyme